MTAPTPLRIATRRSAQASTQARLVAAEIEARTQRPTELVFIDTTGDQRADVPLHTIGGLGVFVKEVQHAVLDGRADIAVHSAKDVPTAPVDGLMIAAYCARRDPRDVLIGRSLAELAEGATVATGSVRRRAQLARMRPDLRFAELRGNIHTRLDKIPEGGAIVMAMAALQILELTDRAAEIFEVQHLVPAPGQGCVAVEVRADDAATIAAVASVDDPATRRAVEAERAFLGAFGTGCSLPIGAHVVSSRYGLHLEVFVDGGDEPRRTLQLGTDPAESRRRAVELARSMAAERSM